MSWHLTKIPKIVHFFWDNRPLSFLRWMSLRSFSTLNPDWKIKFHVTYDSAAPTWKQKNNKHQIQKDYRKWLNNIDGLEIIKETRLTGLHGVYQSDILRNLYLYKDGGIWSDIDILYYKPMERLNCNNDSNSHQATGLCIARRWLPIAFMMGCKKNAFFQEVYNRQLEILSEHSKNNEDYQKFGTEVYQRSVNNGIHPFFVINTNEVYQYQWKSCNNIFSGQVDTSIGVGIHWYGGSPSAAIVESEIDHSNYSESPLSDVIKVSFNTNIKSA